MKRRQLLPPFLAPFLIGLFLSLLLSACTGVPLAMTDVSAAPVTITVSAAASLQEMLEAIAPQFSEANPDIVAEYNFGSSGALQQQIEQGAPADIFFSAATSQMDALEEKGAIISASRQNLVTNRLVLIAPTASQLDISAIAQLKTASFNHLAVGEFRSVPAGQYAQQVLKKLELLDPLQSKFVFGNNVRSVLAAVESGNAELGLVYATDAALSNKVKVIATAPEISHAAIVYPIAVVENTSNPGAAQNFIDFMTTESAQATFAEFGFGKI
ncbi:MAG: molybdate ABC transporter substrate-binding protein [Cyanobacteria bacterium J06634_6]